MTDESYEPEAWKLAVARASAYVQSNATIQIQIFGFYTSAVVIGFGLTNKENKIIMVGIIIPILSFFALRASCFYFNRLTTQHTFVRMFGNRFSIDAEIKSPDQLWSKLRIEKSVGIVNAFYRLRKSDHTGPYPSFFLLYNMVGISSCLYGLVLFNSENNILDLKNEVIVGVIYLVASTLFSIWLTAELTMRAWVAIRFEESH